jgi:hypothetical protein
MKYAWIRDHRRDYPVTVVSSVLEVSPAEFEARYFQEHQHA